MAEDWTALLESVLGKRPCRHRPFVCDGFPDGSQVLIIGHEPATKFDPDWDWWDYWKPQTGFDYDGFIVYYKHYRHREGKPSLSPTRSRLHRIREKWRISAVETNVYQNQQFGASNRRLLHLLIERMDLKAVIAHGDPAKDFVKEAKLPRDLVCRSKHFSRIGYPELDKTCQKIAARGVCTVTD